MVKHKYSNFLKGILMSLLSFLIVSVPKSNKVKGSFLQVVIQEMGAGQGGEVSPARLEVGLVTRPQVPGAN